jgi:hypothetical protein
MKARRTAPVTAMRNFLPIEARRRWPTRFIAEKK